MVESPTTRVPSYNLLKLDPGKSRLNFPFIYLFNSLSPHINVFLYIFRSILLSSFLCLFSQRLRVILNIIRNQSLFFLAPPQQFYNVSKHLASFLLTFYSPFTIFCSQQFIFRYFNFNPLSFQFTIQWQPCSIGFSKKICSPPSYLSFHFASHCRRPIYAILAFLTFVEQCESACRFHFAITARSSTSCIRSHLFLVIFI